MIHSNTEILFELIRAGLWGDVKVNGYRLKIKESSIDWGGVYRLAEEQSVIGLVAAGIENLDANLNLQVPKEWALQFIGQTLQLEQRNKAMNGFIAELVEKMRAAGIEAVLVKGQGVAQCYERPLWRSCGDVDLFLNDDNYEKAKAFLTPLATSVEEEYVREKHLGMTIDGWVVELHGHLYSGLSSRVENELDRLQEDTFYGGQVRSWMNGGTQVFLLAAENDAFYVFTHILQHFYKGGIGLRQICDWCRLLYRYRGELDLQVVESRIRRAGLLSEWRAFGAFAVEYLGMDASAVPFYSDATKWRGKVSRIKDFVMMSGNFGHNRDHSYFEKYPYVVRKCISFGRRCGDLFRHARIFPLDSLRFSFAIMRNGVRSAMRGE